MTVNIYINSTHGNVNISEEELSRMFERAERLEHEMKQKMAKAAEREGAFAAIRDEAICDEKVGAPGTWTKQPPAEDGFYWIRRGPRGINPSVVLINDGLVMSIGTGQQEKVDCVICDFWPERIKGPQ